MPKYPQVKVQLTGEDGNAFAIMGRCSYALKQLVRTGEMTWEEKKRIMDEYTADATSGNYDQLLQLTMEYFDVE